MKKHIKYIGAGLLMGLFIALLIEGISKSLNLQQTLITNIFLVCGLILLAMGISYNFVYLRRYRKRIRNHISLLESGKAETALKDMILMHEELTKKGAKHLAQVVKLNMTAAYCDLKEYDEALNILLELASEKFEGIEDLVYRLNLCACYYYSGNKDGGTLSYVSSEKVFNKYSEDETYGRNIAVIKMMYLIANQKYEEAKNLLKKAKNKWTNPRILNDYLEIENYLESVQEI